MDDAQIQAGFVRNRRFLIAVSLGLACVNVLGLKFPQISILGNSATVEHPERVLILGWIVWGWALAQYVVWYRDVNAWEEFKRAMRIDCENKLGARFAKEAIPKWLVSQLTDELRGRIPAESIPNIQFVSKFARVHGDGELVVRAADIEATAHIRLPDQRGEANVGPVRFEREITSDEWSRQMARATFNVFFSRRFTLEYFAPFFIGFVPVAEFVWRYFDK